MAWNINMSGWRDSNSRPRRPERRALTGLRYTPKEKYKGLRPKRRVPQLAGLHPENHFFTKSITADIFCLQI